MKLEYETGLCMNCRKRRSGRGVFSEDADRAIGAICQVATEGSDASLDASLMSLIRLRWRLRLLVADVQTLHKGG